MQKDRPLKIDKVELASRLGVEVDNSKPYVLAAIVAGVVAFVAILGWNFSQAQSDKKASAAWADYYFNMAGGDAESFESVADKHPSSEAGYWASLTAGNSFLARGIEALYRNRAEGAKLLDQAIGAFEHAIQSSKAELQTKANLGLAKAHESLGDLDAANKYYSAAADTANTPALAEIATRRLAFIKSSEGKEFYEWFSKLDPKPDAPIELPSNMTLPPTTPDLQFSTPASEGTEIDPANLPALPSDKGGATTTGQSPEGATPSLESSTPGLESSTPGLESSTPGPESSPAASGSTTEPAVSADGAASSSQSTVTEAVSDATAPAAPVTDAAIGTVETK